MRRFRNGQDDSRRLSELVANANEGNYCGSGLNFEWPAQKYLQGVGLACPIFRSSGKLITKAKNFGFSMKITAEPNSVQQEI